MKEPDPEKLLGGYATGTLTPQERKVLFEAALKDQTLFDALAEEQALKDVLDEADFRQQLLNSLREPGQTGFWRLLTLFQRPASWAVIGSVVVAAVVIHFTARVGGPPEALNEMATADRPSSAPVPSPFKDRQVEVSGQMEASRQAVPQKEEIVSPPTSEAKEIVLPGRRQDLEPSSAELSAPQGEPPTGATAQGQRELLLGASRAPRLAGAPLKQKVATVLDEAPELRYTILLRDTDGTYFEAESPKVFRRGDSVRLSIEAIRAGYLSVLRQGPDGTWQSVFSGPVSARESHYVPAEGWLLLDRPGGVERLRLTLTHPLESDVQTMVADAVESESGGKGIQGERNVSDTEAPVEVTLTYVEE